MWPALEREVQPRLARRECAQGLRVNYGHFDLLWGRDAPDEIYPMVEQLARARGRNPDEPRFLAKVTKTH